MALCQSKATLPIYTYICIWGFHRKNVPSRNLQSELWRVCYYYHCLLNRKRPVIKTATFVPNLQNESMDRKVWIPFYGLLSIEKWSHIGTLIRHRKRGRKQQQQPSQLVKHIYHIQMMYNYMVYVLHTHLHIDTDYSIIYRGQITSLINLKLFL